MLAREATGPQNLPSCHVHRVLGCLCLRLCLPGLAGCQALRPHMCACDVHTKDTSITFFSLATVKVLKPYGARCPRCACGHPAAVGAIAFAVIEAATLSLGSAASAAFTASSAALVATAVAASAAFCAAAAASAVAGATIASCRNTFFSALARRPSGTAPHPQTSFSHRVVLHTCM